MTGTQAPAVGREICCETMLVATVTALLVWWYGVASCCASASRPPRVQATRRHEMRSYTARPAARWAGEAGARGRQAVGRCGPKYNQLSVPIARHVSSQRAQQARTRERRRRERGKPKGGQHEPGAGIGRRAVCRARESSQGRAGACTTDGGVRPAKVARKRGRPLVALRRTAASCPARHVSERSAAALREPAVRVGPAHPPHLTSRRRRGPSPPPSSGSPPSGLGR